MLPPWIVESAHKLRQKRFVLRGEAVIPLLDGISDFDAALRQNRKHLARALSRSVDLDQAHPDRWGTVIVA